MKAGRMGRSSPALRSRSGQGRSSQQFRCSRCGGRDPAFVRDRDLAVQHRGMRWWPSCFDEPIDDATLHGFVITREGIVIDESPERAEAILLESARHRVDDARNARAAGARHRRGEQR